MRLSDTPLQGKLRTLLIDAGFVGSIQSSLNQRSKRLANRADGTAYLIPLLELLIDRIGANSRADIELRCTELLQQYGLRRQELCYIHNAFQAALPEPLAGEYRAAREPLSEEGGCGCTLN